MSPERYGEKYPDHLLEQYKLYVEMADRVSQRRDQSNRFYATIYSALAAILVLAARFELADNASDGAWGLVFLVVGVVGALLAGIWFMNIRSYRSLNSAKFQIINKIEKHLPAQGYTDEWEILRPADGSPRYLQLTRVEQYVPLVFLALSLALVGYAVYALIQ